jgi:hypothetical protein
MQEMELLWPDYSDPPRNLVFLSMKLKDFRHKIDNIPLEFDDFEVKEAKSELPKNIWETVCA